MGTGAERKMSTGARAWMGRGALEDPRATKTPALTLDLHPLSSSPSPTVLQVSIKLQVKAQQRALVEANGRAP